VVTKSLKPGERSPSAERVLAAIRRRPMTVAELVAALGVTKTAVRTQLTILERDGLVERAVAQHAGGVGKPAFTFAATAEADRVYSRAYIPVLVALVRLLEERLTSKRVAALFEEIGRRLGLDGGSGDLDAVAARLTALGGVISREPAGGGTRITSTSCPLGDVVRVAPATCRIVESYIATVTGASVHEQCLRGKRLRCRFLVE
jgi:DeoR family transcriptional regulator, suf operon transcriptional repressor